MNSESEKIKIEYGKWYWHIGLNCPVVVLHPFSRDDFVACLRPVIHFGQQIHFTYDLAEREQIAKIMIDPAPLDY